MALKRGRWPDGFHIYAGDTVVLETYTFTGEAPVDLSGASAAAMVRSTPEDPVVGFALVCEVDAAQGVVRVLPPDADTARDWLGGKRTRTGAFDLQVTWASGEVETIDACAAFVQMDVTRPEGGV